MRKTARVVIELSFHKGRIPKDVLERMVMHFTEMEDKLLSPFKKYDETLKCSVFYDDFSGIPQVSLIDAFHKPDILGWFRLGKKSKKSSGEQGGGVLYECN